MAEAKDEAIGLETRLSRLETIVAMMEREELELEEALRLFEEGVGHLRAAQAVLQQAELRIERLVDGADGEPVLEPMVRSGG